MKTVILAGGMGTRISEETVLRPKPMVAVGEWPILVHIMMIYSYHGYNDFVIACGYKSEVIKEYFLNFRHHNSDLYIDLGQGEVKTRNAQVPDWKIACVETGSDTMTGCRLRRLKPLLSGERFMVTYGDAVANIDIAALVAFHESHGKLATVTAVRPPARFGALHLSGSSVTGFDEKSPTDVGWINGGFFVFETDVLDLIDGDGTKLETDPMLRLVAANQLEAYCHDEFWQPMDTLRERNILNELWISGDAPWKVW